MGSAVNCYWIINISKSTAVRYKRPTPEVTLMSSVWYSVTSEKVKWKRSENVESLSTYGWFWVALVAPTALQFANSIQPASEPKSPKHDAGHAVQGLKGCMREQCSVKAGLHYVAVNWLYWFSAFAAGFITERNFCREARSREVVMYLACSIRSGLQCW